MYTCVLLQVRIIRSYDQLVYSTRIEWTVSELLCWTLAAFIGYFYWLLLFYAYLCATLYWLLTAVIMLIARSKWGRGAWLFQVTGDVCIIQGSVEGWLVLSWLVNVGWLVIFTSYQHILQMFSTAARLVSAHLKFCKSWVQTQWFLLIWSHDVYTLCFKRISFLHWFFSVFKTLIM